MSGRTLARVLLVVFLVFGAIGLGATAYNAGVSAGLAHEGTVVVSPSTGAPAPYAGSGWGWGFGWGFPFFGFFGGLFFLFILFGLIRAAFGGWGRGWGRGYGRGWSGSGWPDERGLTWEDRARETHDAWHRAHPDTPGSTPPGTGSTGSGGPDRTTP
jgi:hypothetical protein